MYISQMRLTNDIKKKCNLKNNRWKYHLVQPQGKHTKNIPAFQESGVFLWGGEGYMPFKIDFCAYLLEFVFFFGFKKIA